MGLVTAPPGLRDAWALADEHMRYGHAMKIGYQRASSELRSSAGSPADRARYALRAIRDTVRVTDAG